MTDLSRSSYLFLLQRRSTAARREAARVLAELGATVVAQYGNVAIEAVATDDQAAAAADMGLFLNRLKGPMGREQLGRLDDAQRRVMTVWNARFSRGYRRLERDRTLRGLSWGEGGEDREPPLPFTPIDPEDFLELAARYEADSGERIRPEERPKGNGQVPDVMTPDEFVEYERRLVDHYRDEELAYHLARLAYRLGPRYYEVIAQLPGRLIELIWEWLFPEATCWRMTGEMSVGLVFVESSQSGGPRFTSAERNEVCAEVVTGLNWLSSQHPSGDLSWVYDLQFISIAVADGTNSSNESYWRDPAMGQVTYDGNTYAAAWSSVAEYREDMRLANWSDHALVIFVTPFANSWHAYAGSGRVTLARRNNWGGWGRGTIDMITAHEVSHLFGAADEYTGSGTPCSSCSTTHGCDHVLNGNCGACASPRQDCAMDGNSQRLCGYTRGQIGWSDLFVELSTADELWAGTDDTVWIEIGDHTFDLDTVDHDDRERGNVEGYPIWAPWLQQTDIKRVLIRKSPDGFAGGWKLARVRVWFRGELKCDASPNQWLEDDHRWWLGCVNDRELVNKLRVKVSTADVAWAGTDDDVTLTLAGRDWNLDDPDRDDFERNHTDAFDLDPGVGFYRGDIHSIRIHKSPDGFAGGWRLKGVELIVNGSTIYSTQSINRWLEDDDRTWSASI